MGLIESSASSYVSKGFLMGLIESSASSYVSKGFLMNVAHVAHEYS